MGMTYQLYWYGDPWAIRAYHEADKLKQQRANNDAWLQGMYVYDAIGRLAPVLHAFAKKGTKPQKYVPEPYAFGEKTKREQKQIAENERLKSILFFKNWSRSVSKKFEEGRRTHGSNSRQLGN